MTGKILTASAAGLVLVLFMAGFSMKNAFASPASPASTEGTGPAPATRWVPAESEALPESSETVESTEASFGYRVLPDGREVYRLPDGSYYTGWVKTSEGYWYFGDNGYRLSGWLSLPDGDYYLQGGVMAVGLAEVNGERVLFDENGRAASGWTEWEGKTYYCGEKGILQKGFLTVDKKLYAFDSESGELLRDQKVENYVAGADGSLRPDFDQVTEDNLDDYVRYILTVHGSTPRDIYNYVYNYYTWRYTDRASELTMTLRMFNAGVGGCWDYAAITCCLLRAAGYDCMFVKGYTPNNRVHEHDWVLVEIEEGVWRHMDPMRQGFDICLLTDAQLAAYDGLYNMYYEWDRSAYPAASGSGSVKIKPVEKSDKTKASEAATEAATTETVTTEAVTTEEATTEAVTTEEAVTEAVSTEETASEAVSTEETAAEPVSTEETVSEAASTEETAAEPVSTESTAAEAVSTEKKKADPAPTEEIKTEPAAEASTEAAADEPAAEASAQS